MKPNGDFITLKNFLILQEYPISKGSSMEVFVANFQRITNQSLSTKFSSDIKIFNDRNKSLSDERNGPTDVFCNIRSFINPDSTVGIIQTSFSIPENFSLHQNYPNPFNSSTEIKFDIKQSNNYKLEIFNYLGQSVREIFNMTLSPGAYKINFESRDMSSGIYFYILSSETERSTKSFVLIK
jgi:hypothetical protein